MGRGSPPASSAPAEMLHADDQCLSTLVIHACENQRTYVQDGGYVEGEGTELEVSLLQYAAVLTLVGPD
jgi:hypothetical protein